MRSYVAATLSRPATGPGVASKMGHASAVGSSIGLLALASNRNANPSILKASARTPKEEGGSQTVSRVVRNCGLRRRGGVKSLR